ncbi:MAG TPA: hypothetical protein VIQ02_03420 [Jiangellaceae bacterium]
MSTLTTDLLPARTAGIAAAVGFLTIAAFQAVLALGAPLGRAAWGGTHAQLPTALRVASAVAFGFWALAALIVLGRAGVHISPLPSTVLRWGTWILVGMLAIGALLNFASPSSWERFLWGPIALILAGLCLLLALSAATPAAS